MSDEANDALETLECDVLAEAGTSRVVIWRPVREAFDGLDDTKQGRISRVMTLWCDNQRLTPEMFNANEGRSKDNHLIQAFKTHKIRFYGFVLTVQGLRTFVVIDADLAKKQNKADPGVLKRAKGRADEVGKRNNS